MLTFITKSLPIIDYNEIISSYHNPLRTSTIFFFFFFFWGGGGGGNVLQTQTQFLLVIEFIFILTVQ